MIAVQAEHLLDQARVKLQQANILFLEERFDDCQALLNHLSKMRLSADMLAKVNKLYLKLYEITNQWELAYRLLQKMRTTTLFTQSRLRAIAQLIATRT